MSAVARTAEVHLLHGGRSEAKALREAWLNTLRSRQTRVAYRRAVDMAFTIMKREHPKQVTHADIARFIRTQEDKAPATVALRVAALKSYFLYLITAGEISSNPTTAIKPPKVHSPRPRGISMKEARRIAASINTETVVGKRDAIAIALLFGGMRVSEVAALNVGDVRVLEEGGISFVRIHVRSGKGNKPRDVDLPRRIRDLIDRYLETRGSSVGFDEPLLVATCSGYRCGLGRMPADRIYRQLRQYARRAKVEITGSHVGRHTWSREAEANGAKVSDICDHLGHASLAVTQVYLRRLAGNRNPASDAVPVVL